VQTERRRQLTLDDVSRREGVAPQSGLTVSPDGSYLAYASTTDASRHDGGAGHSHGVRVRGVRVRVVELATGESAFPLGDAESWAACWSPSGRLAFLTLVDEQVRVAIWQPGGQAYVLRCPSLRGRLFDLDAPQWIPDERNVLVGLDDTPTHPNPEVQQPYDVVQSSALAGARLTSSRAEPELTQFALVAVDASGFTRIGDPRPVAEYRLCPRGRLIAVTAYDVQHARVVADLTLVDVDTGRTRRLAEQFPADPNVGVHPPAWSPDGARLAQLIDDQVVIWHVDNSSAPDEDRFTLPFAPWPQYLAWDHDGSGMFVYGLTGSPDAADGLALHRLDLLDRGLRELGHPRLLSRNGTSVVSTDADSHWLALTRRGDAVITIDPATGHVETRHTSEAQLRSTFGARIAGAPSDVAVDGSVLVCLHDEPAAPSSIVIGDARDGQLRTLRGFNAHLSDVELGRWRRVEFQAASGRALAIQVLLPPGAGEGPFPTVVQIYPGLVGPAGSWDAFDEIVQPQLLASRGYAFAAIDLPSRFASRHATPEELTDTILPALDELVRLGLAHPDRFVAMGHSAGGHAVNRLITLDQRFSCAVSSAGIANTASLFGSVSPDGQLTGAHVNAMLGIPTPAEDPQLHVSLSPVFHARSVRTPLLLLHSVNDVAVPVTQAEEMFVALSAAGGQVALIRYQGEVHTPRMFRDENWRHANEAVINWLLRHCPPDSQPTETSDPLVVLR